jgi:RNA polymerase sigma-70 factor (ECF subfamily)
MGADLESLSDSELLAAHCRGAGPEAFEALYRRYGRMVYATCLRRLGDAAEAEDAAAAAFMVLLRKAGTLSRSRHSLAGWLQWCAVNTARKAAWLRLRQQDRERRAAEMREERASPEAGRWAAALPHLDEALASLPAAQREAVILHHMQDRTLASIAAELAVPEATVAGRVRLGLEKLRGRLARHGPALPVAALTAGLATAVSGVELPAGLAARVVAAALGQAAGGAAAAVAGATVKAMAWMKVKIAAAFLCGAAVIAGGGTAAVISLTSPAGDAQLSAMPDNSWLRLEAPREPVGRAYCGTAFGGGLLWYFGGGKHTYLGNDVELYDSRRNQWRRATEPEQPAKGSPDWNTMTSTGGATSRLSPLGRPYAEQTHQQVCWLPDRGRFFVVLVSSGTWEFDPVSGEWSHLVNRFANPAAEPRGDWGHNQVLWDPALGAPVHAVNSGPDAHFRVFDFTSRSWRRLAPVPAAIKWNSWYSTWVPDWKAHLVAAGVKDGARFHRLDLAGGAKIEPVSAPPGLAGCDSLDCDPANRVVVALEADRPARPWKLDLATGAWEQLSPSGRPPPTGGLWGTFKYDPGPSAFLFVCFEGNRGLYRGGPSSTWAYRYRKAAASSR